MIWFLAANGIRPYSSEVQQPQRPVLCFGSRTGPIRVRYDRRWPSHI